nr:unnamed protein product [Digitaria exilis]
MQQPAAEMHPAVDAPASAAPQPDAAQAAAAVTVPASDPSPPLPTPAPEAADPPPPPPAPAPKTVTWSEKLTSDSPTHVHAAAAAESSQYVSHGPAASSSKGGVEVVKETLSRWGKTWGETTKMVESLSRDTWQHFKTGPSFAEAAMGRLAQGTKVVIPLHQLRAANPSVSKVNPAEKYIQVVSVEGHEFWFMGFLMYEKATASLQEALDSARELQP